MIRLLEATGGMGKRKAQFAFRFPVFMSCNTGGQFTGDARARRPDTREFVLGRFTQGAITVEGGAASTGAVRCGSRDFCFIVWLAWECNADARATALQVVGGDGAAMGPHHSIDEGKAKAMSVRISSFDPPFEQVRQDIWREARTIVFANQQC